MTLKGRVLYSLDSVMNTKKTNRIKNTIILPPPSSHICTWHADETACPTFDPELSFSSEYPGHSQLAFVLQ